MVSDEFKKACDEFSATIVRDFNAASGNVITEVMPVNEKGRDVIWGLLSRDLTRKEAKKLPKSFKGFPVEYLTLTPPTLMEPMSPRF